MGIPVTGQVGTQALGDGTTQAPLRQGRTGELIASELHGRFYEQNYRSALFSGGMTATSIANVTFTTGTLGATCTPIAGLWNPSTSTVNLVILQASVTIAPTAATKTGAGPLVWATATGELAISTGNAPVSRRTLVASGSQAKDMSGVALTGKVANLVVRSASVCGGGSAPYSQVDGTVAAPSPMLVTTVENIDGAYIVPPGGVLALLGTTTPVATSAASMILWEEVAT